MDLSIDKVGCVNHFQKAMGEQIENIGATRAALGRILRSLDLVGWSRNEEAGRLDRKSLTRVAAGATSVFARRDIKQADASAVTIMVDCSGSMAGAEMVVAGKVAIQLGKLLEQSKVNFAVTGFTGSEPKTDYDDDAQAYVDRVEFLPFKERGESTRSAAPKLGHIRHSASGGNPDYSALMFCIEEIRTQKEQRKIIFFLTDTGSYIKSHMKHVQKIAADFGITIIAIGIGTDNVTTMFKHAVDVQNLSDLGKDTFTTLLRTLRSKD
jgi:hypothetical protein